MSESIFDLIEDNSSPIKEEKYCIYTPTKDNAYYRTSCNNHFSLDVPKKYTKCLLCGLTIKIGEYKNNESNI